MLGWYLKQLYGQGSGGCSITMEVEGKDTSQSKQGVSMVVREYWRIRGSLIWWN
jgi:hypothetical protein